ncbi:MAG: response regulator [Chitinophagaceae bacterium]|nr:response regulator [Chitinophagaceae bacterium]
MNQYGPIIVIEDDNDDQQLLMEVFEELKYPNKVLFFSDGFQALAYLEKSQDKPFLILSDINLPRLNGFELRRKIHNNEALRLKCIPYLFFTTSAAHQAIIDAYSESVQGFFVKPASYAHLVRTIRRIMEYWMECKAPFSHAAKEG